MRSQRSGQATFIPLDTIKVKPINDRLRSLAKGTRLAVEIVLCDPSVERAVHHACGNALICDTMEIARHVSYDRDQDVKGACPLGINDRSDWIGSCDIGWHGNPQEWSYYRWPKFS